MLKIIFSTLVAFCSTFAFADFDEDQLAERERTFEQQKDGSGLYRHNEDYFLYGNPDTKVQISLKYQLVDDFDLFFGYTQVMFWDLTKDSSPFTDINYNPELFYRWYTKNGIVRGIDLGGFEHKSNGRDGPQSRSMNRSYVKVRTKFEVGAERFEWDSKVFALYGLDDNRDLANRLGYVEFRLSWLNAVKVSFLKDSELEIRFAPGGTLDLKDIQGYRELNFKFHPNIQRFNPAIFAQVYNGYAESFLKYQENRTGYRIGISL